jgi:AhpD family alkylhydroperoxidase
MKRFSTASGQNDTEAHDMMLDWNAYQSAVTAGVAGIARTNAAIVRGYRELSNAGENGVLDRKTRELIAIAVGVTRQCDGCITTHVDAAIKHGATREEIVEALGVAISVNAGAALVYSTRALDAYQAKTTP